MPRGPRDGHADGGRGCGCLSRRRARAAAALALVLSVLHPSPTRAEPACTVHVPAEGPAVTRPLDLGSLRLGHVVVDRVGDWHNRKNRLREQPTTVTLDLGRALPVRRVRLDCNPPNKWHSLSRARIEASVTGEEWSTVAEEAGPGPTREVGAVPFELAADMSGAFRFVRAVVTPQSFYRLSIRTLLHLLIRNATKK